MPFKKPRYIIPDIIKSLYETNAEKEVEKYQNLLSKLLAVPILVFGSVINFIVRYFIVNQALMPVLLDSLVLLVLGLFFELFSRVLRDEAVKSNVFIALSSVILVFLVLRFYQRIGATVWTISSIFILVALLRKRKKTVISLSITLFLLGSHVTVNLMSFDQDLAYFLSQMVAFSVLFFVAAIVHEIFTNRIKLIDNQNEQIRRSETRLQLTLSSIGEGVITVDNRQFIEFMNPVAEQMTGWMSSDAIGKSFDTVFHIVDEDSGRRVVNYVGKSLDNDIDPDVSGHKVLISADGTQRVIEITSAQITENNQESNRVVLVIRDSTERRERHRQIEYLSYHDQLTGLYNRHFFDEELKRLDQKRNIPFSIVVADINGLKTINDAFGHQTGDELIKTAAAAIRETCRSDDIIARMGGDEFMLLLPRSGLQVALKLAERIKRRIETFKIMDIELSVSVGCATKTDDEKPINQVIKSAEDMMYQRKILSSSSKRSAVIRSILNTLHLKSPRENAHSQRVSRICVAFGKSLALSEDETNELRMAGELHDIGKIALDSIILNKPGKLTDEEFREIQNHPETGYRLLGTSSEYFRIADCVHAHHERWDGSGYPGGLSKEAIHWKARIISIADSYDAMRCDRPYRRGLSHEQAIEEIGKGAGTQFDPALVDMFIKKVADQFK